MLIFYWELGISSLEQVWVRMSERARACVCVWFNSHLVVDSYRVIRAYKEHKSIILLTQYTRAHPHCLIHIHRLCLRLCPISNIARKRRKKTKYVSQSDILCIKYKYVWKSCNLQAIRCCESTHDIGNPGWCVWLLRWLSMMTILCMFTFE